MPLRAIFAALVVLLISGAACADTVTGIVRDVGGLPIPGATVECAGGTTVSGVTSATGAFAIVLAGGTYTISILPATTAFAPLRLFDVVVAGTSNLGILTLAQGFVVSGLVTAASAAPLAGADINVYDVATGEKLFTPSDTTAAGGTFSVVLPAGTFDVRAAPPAGQILVAQLQAGVVVAGPLTLPTFVLPPGVLLSGTVRHSVTNLPVVDCDIDVDIQGTGMRIPTPGDNTDQNGMFSVVVLTGVLQVSFDPLPGTPIQGRRVMNVPVAAATNIGIVTLEPGTLITGTVRNSMGMALAHCDLDVDQVLGRIRVYTSNDSTDGTGNFSIAVPPMAVDITIDPPAGAPLVSQLFAGVQGAIPQSLGNITLQPGSLLSGYVYNGFGQPEPGANLDVIDPVTQAVIPTPNDTTAADGSYALYVPNGTWNVRIRTRKASLLFDLTQPVVVNGPTNYSPGLPLSPIASYLSGVAAFPVVGNGGVLLVDFALFNASPYPNAGELSATLEDPAGTITTIVPPFPVILGPNQLVFIPSLAVPLPLAAPVYQGLPYRMHVQITYPGTSIVYESDSFTYTLL